MVSDIVGSVFSTVLFHRTLGKFSCHKHNLYSLGSVGFQDVDLPVLEITHVSSLVTGTRRDGGTLKQDMAPQAWQGPPQVLIWAPWA